MKRKIEQFETMAREMVGDGGAPELYFVSDGGAIVTVTRDFSVAYSHWRSIAGEYPRRECALESRRIGCVCTVEPEEDGSKRLIVIDDSRQFGLRESA